jgi:hypothetical protein
VIEKDEFTKYLEGIGNTFAYLKLYNK